MKSLIKRNLKLLAGAMAFVMVMGVLSGANFITKAQAEVTTTQATTQVPTTKVPETTKPKKKKIKKIKLKKPKIKVKRYKKTSAKVTWKKVKKAQKYIVFGGVKGKKLKQIKTTKKKKYIDKGLKRGKTYKYKVVAVAKKQGKTFKSKASKTKKVYIPKKKKRKKVNVVVCGECFVEGMDIYAKGYLPAKTRLVHKIGISTSGVLNNTYFRYKGKAVTALEKVARYQPKVVYFLVGMNEARGNSVATIRNYKKIIKLLKKVQPNIKIVLMALPPVGRKHASGFASNSKINSLNKKYKKLANSTKNVYYFGSYRKLMTDGSGYLKGSANGGDGGHWSAGITIKVVKALKKHSKQFID